MTLELMTKMNRNLVQLTHMYVGNERIVYRLETLHLQRANRVTELFATDNARYRLVGLLVLST